MFLLIFGIICPINFNQAATNGQNRALPRLDENRNSSPDVRFLGKYFPGNDLFPGKCIEFSGKGWQISLENSIWGNSGKSIEKVFYLALP